MEEWNRKKALAIYNGSELIVRLLIVVGIVCMQVYFTPFVREIEATEWADYSFPFPKQNFPVYAAIIIEAAGWCIALIVGVCVNRFIKGYSYKVVGLEALVNLWGASLAVLGTSLVIEFIKRLYGRPRPCFLSVCSGTDEMELWLGVPWYPVGAPVHNSCCDGWANCGIDNNNDNLFCNQYFGTQGVYTNLPKLPRVPDCERIRKEFSPALVDAGRVDPGRSSQMYDMRVAFPSEHSGTSFAAFVYSAMYLCEMVGNSKGWITNTSWIVIVVLMSSVPLWIALSRTQTYRHSIIDVSVGSVIGIVMALISFRVYYPSKLMKEPISKTIFGLYEKPFGEV